jgi:two-component sensor histidine kinase
MTADGRLWFPTSRGLAVIDPKAAAFRPEPGRPILNIVAVTADAREIDVRKTARFFPGTKHIQFRYSGIYLRDPGSVRYEYKLEGLDPDWISNGSRRVISFDGLGHGAYTLRVRSSAGGQSSDESAFDFEVRPHLYQMQYFWWLCGSSLLAISYALYQFRLRQIRNRFVLVLDERTRIAREIHDTLAQSLVGISTKLDAIITTMRDRETSLGQDLQLLQRMARYCVTEARRSVMDLRCSVLDSRDLPAAITEAAQQWMAGSATPVKVEISGEAPSLPDAVEKNVLRIAQELVTNARKHASAERVLVHLQIEEGSLLLTVWDDGRGFDSSKIFVAGEGHFGLLGIRERVERLRGTMNVSSTAGHGTKVSIHIPVSTQVHTTRRKRPEDSSSPFRPIRL